MPLFMPTSEPDDLLPEIVSMAVPPLIGPTTRAAPVLRIRRVGQVYFVEHLHKQRAIDADNKEVITDDWKAVAVAKPPDARKDAFEWMHNANNELLKLSASSPGRTGE